jgi:anti-sigma factor RsiW
MSEDLDLLIDEYLDGRMDPPARARFEARMQADPELRGKVMSTTRSVQLVQQALGWVTPGEQFDEQVNSKIISITQSGQNLRPVQPDGSRAAHAQADMLADEAQAESRRLLLIAVIAAVAFAAAVCVGVYAILHLGK